MKTTFWAGLAFLLCAAGVRADEIVRPPNGLWVTPTREQGHTKLFGASNKDAAWHVTQWGSPRADLSAFSAGVAKGSNEMVKLLGDEIEISANGKNLACRQEFDTFIGANNEQNQKGYPSAYRQSPPLSEMKALMHRITVRPELLQTSDSHCKPTQAVLMTAIVFKNRSNNSTFFYQLRLHKLGIDPKPFWYAKGKKGTFGFGDNLASYGVADARMGERNHIEVDLLPRIKELLRSGEVSIDRDPSHWIVSNVYHGSAMWGNVELRVAWSGFRLEYR